MPRGHNPSMMPSLENCASKVDQPDIRIYENSLSSRARTLRKSVKGALTEAILENPTNPRWLLQIVFFYNKYVLRLDVSVRQCQLVHNYSRRKSVKSRLSMGSSNKHDRASRICLAKAWICRRGNG